MFDLPSEAGRAVWSWGHDIKSRPWPRYKSGIIIALHKYLKSRTAPDQGPTKEGAPNLGQVTPA